MVLPEGDEPEPGCILFGAFKLEIVSVLSVFISNHHKTMKLLSWGERFCMLSWRVVFVPLHSIQRLARDGAETQSPVWPSLHFLCLSFSHTQWDNTALPHGGVKSRCAHGKL